jgi:hypothetical protein
VFNTQYRLPRHRYLKYKLLKNSKINQDQIKKNNSLNQPDVLNSISEFNNNFILNATQTSFSQPWNPEGNSSHKRQRVNNGINSVSQTKNGELISSYMPTKLATNFTLRKRIKPKRKFHRKRVIKAGGLIFPRRRKFITKTFGQKNINELTKTTDLSRNDQNTSLRWRPATDYNKNKLESAKTRLKTDTIRRRKLRRKVFKQIFKPTQRFQPRYGGAIWPGDYPRLEFTDMPKLTISKTSIINLEQQDETFDKVQRKQKTKEKRKIAPMVGLLPHRNLLEKHNILVLKKKLEKAQRSNKISERVKQFKVMYKTN